MRKGQAAMEFLMTYGWAILVVLAAIAALAYFGVLSPDRFFPDKCIIQGGGFSCVESSVSGTSVTLVVRNSGGENMAEVNMTLTSETGDCDLGAAQVLGALPNSNQTSVTYTCAGATDFGGASKFRGSIILDYRPSEKALVQRATGSITKVIN